MKFFNVEPRCVWLSAGLLLAWAGLGRGAGAGGGFENLKKSYEEELARTLQPLKEGYRKALLALEGQLCGKGDYAGAQRVQQERLLLERQNGAPEMSGKRDVRMEGGRIVLGAPAESGGGLKQQDGTWSSWEVTGGYLRWGLPAGLRGGGYAVEIVYVSEKEGKLSLGLREDFHTLNRVVHCAAAPDGGMEGRVRLGTLRVRPGAATLELKVAAPGTVGDFKVKELFLVPMVEEL